MNKFVEIFYILIPGEEELRRELTMRIKSEKLNFEVLKRRELTMRIKSEKLNFEVLNPFKIGEEEEKLCRGSAEFNQGEVSNKQSRKEDSITYSSAR